MKRALVVPLYVALACARTAPAPSGAVAAARPGSGEAAAADPLTPARLDRLRAYVRATWPTLTRTIADLPRAAADPKTFHPAATPWPVYLPRDEDPARIAAGLRRVLPEAALATIVLRPLPADHSAVDEHGILYLPRPYVVPGGRFNEMYGWDSYFILLGLLDDGALGRARDLVDDFLYEVVHYGGVLNANRTYYLSRSQPPLLGEMVMALYRATGDRTLLVAARPALEATYRHWTAPPHLVVDGLSRYYDHGEGPAPEVLTGERDATGATHYDRVRGYFRAHPEADPTGDAYDRLRGRLTPAFYKGDRSMRESGFDPTGRFGPFGAEVIHYAPVCLNTLLFRLEQDLAAIEATLGRPSEAAQWIERARQRRAAIDEHLSDEAAGLYLDYDVRTGQRGSYPFATTFWPLWAGLASAAQARRVQANLGSFERAGGILTSTIVSGNQWDAPFGWAPLELLAVEGLHRSGFDTDALRIARAFLGLLVEDFERRGTLVEKYDVVRRTSDVAGQLRFGYATNEVGFGWTNGVALELVRLLGQIPCASRRRGRSRFPSKFVRSSAFCPTLPWSSRCTATRRVW